MYLLFWIVWIIGLLESENSLDIRVVNINLMKEMELMIIKKYFYSFISVK